MDEMLVFSGGAVKALGDGVYGGYGVLFTTESDPDLQREFFTKATDYELEGRSDVPVYWHHGLDPQVKSTKLGRATFRIDDVGIWFETKLEERTAYEKAIKKLADMEKLGMSTGAVSHLVRKKSLANATELVAWPVGELSFDHRPVEPRTSVVSVKSLLEEETFDLEGFVKSLEEPIEEEPVSLEGLPALKALCEALSPAVSITRLEHSQIADAAVKELLTHNKVFVDAFKHYRVRLDQHVEFRKERNRKPMSDSQSASIKSWKDGLSGVRQGIESIETDLEGTLKRTETALAEADAAEQHAKFLMQQLNNLTLIAKE